MQFLQVQQPLIFMQNIFSIVQLYINLSYSSLFEQYFVQQLLPYQPLGCTYLKCYEGRNHTFYQKPADEAMYVLLICIIDLWEQAEDQEDR